MNLTPLLRKLAPLLALAAVATPTQAFAWKHTYQVWCDAEDMPLQYYVSDYVEDSVTEGYPNTAIQNAYDEWTTDAPCASVSGEYAGVGQNIAWRNDGKINFSFDDPGDDNAAGVLAATLTYPLNGGRTCFIRDGSTYFSATDSDIVYNDNVDWATEEQIANTTCSGESSLQGVSVHEIGHMFGMGHSCDQGDACTSTVLRDATMYWIGGPCDSAQSTLNEDDIEGITRLYGPSAAITCNNEIDPEDPATIAFGSVPFDLRCSVVSDNRAEIDEAATSWNWGDGNSSTGLDVEHEYTVAGNYTLQAEVHGTNATCGEWSNTARKIGYVRACDVPQPEFTYSHVNGLSYQMLNETNVSVYGCIYDIEWDIFEPGGTEPVARLKAWEPEYTFDQEGEYRVVLNIGGPAGTGAAELTMDVRNSRGEGYGCSTAGFGAGAFGLVGIALLVRRRR